MDEHIASAERMLKNEEEHLAFLINIKPDVSMVCNIDKLIESAERWISHFKERIEFYKSKIN